MSRRSTHPYINVRNGEITCSSLVLRSPIDAHRCVQNFLYNNRLGVAKQTYWLPLISDFLPLRPNLHWSSDFRSIAMKDYKPNHIHCTVASAAAAFETVLRSYSTERIGIHISGGLDSSLLVGLARSFGYYIVGVGLTTDRFEFRTERAVQLEIAEMCDECILVPYEEVMPASGLYSLPFHPFPDLAVLNYAADRRIATEFASRGIHIVLSGGGGDNLFGMPVSNETRIQTNLFVDHFVSSQVYEPLGLRLVAPYSAPQAIDSILSLRAGHGADWRKLWARSAFSAYLPERLIRYYYNTDFAALFSSGLIYNRNALIELVQQQASNIPSTIFRIANQSLSDFERLSDESLSQTDLESVIAIAAWLRALEV
jgi:hypothetical protein